MPRTWPKTNAGLSSVLRRQLSGCGVSCRATVDERDARSTSTVCGTSSCLRRIDRTKALIFATHAGIALGAAEARENAPCPSISGSTESKT